MRVDEVGMWLGLSEDSTYRAIAAGEIPSLRIGRRVLVPTAALRRLVCLDSLPEPGPVG